MERKISFHNMQHSDPMEQHTNQKLDKLEELLKREKDATPLFLEIWLKANALHPHHRVEIHLKTPSYDLNAHEEGTDMYVVIDSAIDKMVKLVKKEKERIKDKNRKGDSEKRDFGNDKYPLSD